MAELHNYIVKRTTRPWNPFKEYLKEVRITAACATAAQATGAMLMKVHVTQTTVEEV